MISERDPRVYFAAERTLLAWIRTGLAMMGFGFVVARFGLYLREMTALRGEDVANTGGGSLWAGITLVVLGVIVNLYGAVAHARFSARFHRGEREPHDPRFGIILSSVLALIGIALVAYLLLRS